MNDPESDSLEDDSYAMEASEIDPYLYPRMSNISAGFIYNGIIRPDEPELPEYVSIPMGVGLNSGIKLQVGVSQWNMLWEVAQF
ncbi:hypothetical protein E9229_003952, partial [Paeniglutamicibacter cryotolerans]|nr:hypothetical protein [Paeniglutamicibacter cryotolerans]